MFYFGKYEHSEINPVQWNSCLYVKPTCKIQLVGHFTTWSCLFTGTLPVKDEPDVPTVKPENKTIGNFKDLSYHIKVNLFCVPLDYNVYNQLL